ncbi:MAG: glucosidase family protein, partial [Anaerolineae bacterium]
LAGDHSTEIEFKVTNLEPETLVSAVHPGFMRAWGSQFTYRPEHGGFSNNSFGVNAENCLYFIADLAPYTRASAPLPSMTELLRSTLELAIKGGPGYACFPEEAHDTSPSQLISAGRIYQVDQSPQWVLDVWPFLKRRVEHILDNRDENGFYICKRLSGNSRSFHTSSNAWDTLCFGHADGYSAALAYRALRNAVVLARAAEDAYLAEACNVAAQHLREVFVPTLFNPQTGWLGGWRSADGDLHDHAMHFVTAMAAIYGILEPAQAREMLSRLEEKRLSAGLNDFRYGLPPQFVPVPARDHWSDGGWSRTEVPHRADGADTFGIFTNGGVSPVFCGFYLRALSQFGFTATADRLSDQLLDSFDRGQFEGCLNGAECYTLDGMPSGYEGTLAHCYHVLLAIGIHKGWIKPLASEWWPEE